MRDPALSSSSDKAVCGFCKGQPVIDAASWVGGSQQIAPCSRCGNCGETFDNCSGEVHLGDGERRAPA